MTEYRCTIGSDNRRDTLHVLPRAAPGRGAVLQTTGGWNVYLDTSQVRALVSELQQMIGDRPAAGATAAAAADPMQDVLATLTARVDTLETRSRAADGRLDTLESPSDPLAPQVSAVTARLSSLEFKERHNTPTTHTRLKALEDRLDRITSALGGPTPDRLTLPDGIHRIA